MTDAQFGALLTAVVGGLGGIAAMIRWAITRVTKAMDDQSSSNLRLATAQIELAGALAALRADIEGITRFIQQRGPVPSPSLHERTPASGMPTMTPTQLRAFERHDDENAERPGPQRRREAGPRRTTSAKGVPVAQRRENYRRPDSNHDEDSGER